MIPEQVREDVEEDQEKSEKEKNPQGRKKYRTKCACTVHEGTFQ